MSDNTALMITMATDRKLGGAGMRSIVTIALSALLLSGCVAHWPSHRTGPRFSSGPNLSPISNAPSYSGGDAPGQIHGIGN
jgi:hypothetical protein